MRQGLDTVKVTKVTEAVVEQGTVRREDGLGNGEADTAADLGRRHQTDDVMEYTVMLQLHRKMVAVSRDSVDHDDRGGSAPDPIVWIKKHRKVDIRVNVDLASMPCPPGFLHGPWVQVHGGCISGSDIAA